MVTHTSSSISIVAKIFGDVDLSVLGLYFSHLNLALKVIWERAGGFPMSLNILTNSSIFQPFLIEE